MRMIVNLHPAPGTRDRLAVALNQLRTRAVRWTYDADGLAHAGGHSGALDYEPTDDLDDVGECADEDLAALEPLIDRERSVVVAGSDVHFVACAPQPVRFSYFMRRRSDFTHHGYLERYHDIHSAFGEATPGIEGYTQLHVDVDASARAAERLALGVCDFDSVSELHLTSLDSFVAALATSGFGAEALADEDLFVDRGRSWDYVQRRL